MTDGEVEARMIRAAVAGATGWVGRSLVPAILAAPDLELVAAVARSAQGRPLRDAVPGTDAGLRISGTVDEALAAEPDVLVEYTAPDAAKAHALAAIRAGVHVVIGTSGLDDDDYGEIGDAAAAAGVGVIAAGNFALSAVLLQRFAEMAAQVMPAWEVIDYSDARKPDAPSGTVRELVHRLSRARQPETEIPIEATLGEPAARGLTLHGTQVHSVRVPGFVIGAEVIFGREDERLTLRYDGGAGAGPYVAGTLLAIRRVADRPGLRRGLDELLGR